MAPLKHHIQRHCATAKRHFWNAFVPHEGNDHKPHALRHKALTAYAVIIIVVKVIVSGTAFVYPGPSATADLTQGEIVRLTNESRVTKGLKPLQVNKNLTTGAEFKADDMLSKQYFAHVSPTKVTPWYWFKKAGYNYSSAGENLAIDFTTAEDVVEAWLDSPTHRKNLLNSKYRDIGVAVSTGQMNGMSSTVVVQFFGVAVVPKQQAKVVAKVVPKKPVTQQKPSVVAKENPVPKPVLGEQTETKPAPAPPAVPKLTVPQSGSILSTVKPWIAGESQPDVLITVYDNKNRIGAVVSDAQGYFSLQPEGDLVDGAHELTAIAQSGGLSSVVSAADRIMIDTEPPSAALGTTIVLPSYLTPGGLMVTGTIEGQDVASAVITVGTTHVDIQPSTGSFIANLPPARYAANETIDIELKDAIGNVSVVQLASLSFLDTTVVRSFSREGIAEWIPHIIFFSQKFFITFWLFLFIVLAVNVIVKVRVQHRPVILYTLLLLYGLTIVMITS
ncbi:MAG: CAP domain-containing protein [Candidatus Kerfeldbacteria bacterium]